MQLLTTSDIATRYAAGVVHLSNITYNKFIKDKYGVQFRATGLDSRMLMLMYAVNRWSNLTGAINWLTNTQLSAVLQQMAYIRRDPLTALCTADSPSACGSYVTASTTTTSSSSGATERTYVNYYTALTDGETILTTTVPAGARIIGLRKGINPLVPAQFDITSLPTITLIGVALAYGETLFIDYAI